jgi:hypothetical protein
MEAAIRSALSDAGIRFVEDGNNPAHLDFYLPDFDLYIEVKQFHTDRISEQMSRAPNVIVAQGREAVTWLANLISGGGFRSSLPSMEGVTIGKPLVRRRPETKGV